jgi:hypothetical protein
MQNVLALFRKILKLSKTNIRNKELRNKEIKLVDTYNVLQSYLVKCF